MKAQPVLTDEQEIENFLDSVKFDSQGLVPAVVQDAAGGEVLMVAWMNRESLRRSLESGRTWFYSRSRQCLWPKGETSGNYQYIREVYCDCDGDTLLFKVEQVGAACHKGTRSCFSHVAGTTPSATGFPEIITGLYALLGERRKTLPEGSYTASLFRKGIDRIVQKVGEEAVEVVIAGKNRDREELIEETADLVYHLLVLLVECGVTPEDICAKLAERRR
ncbi:MAG: phosphoribosyl-AMP cyclohydrolase / phosphoribosyl-ATP pyrophosphohydrolase [Thermacetogenium sp.]|uniref:Histidine biosynthesis bifunctional protein HisIE n=1 Tax=Thermacetogenium phaeum TaxID=85874 RepID=A0A101FHF5_9THEO|nr:MAG: Histidine biosynthesis bifunctional protein HisIE [Thermacetogenium phaeum]MDN5365065.1 phosphoribosyl-AMP cyclohydrolase / phosphoribosyl-ATP pyrophosphohydrolase [Thermacetogenium sp.]MDN5375645.1 phosphoribosyl-AMP cyclohydrolase / phosphoribosyl-ATP pyrophosphohydrolase [Thermacetogenium sp.]